MPLQIPVSMLLVLLLGGCLHAMLLGKDLQNLGPDQNVTDLHRAVERGDFRAVETLLASGASAAAVTKKGRTPLFIAVKNRDVAIAEYLITHGAEGVERGYYFSDDDAGIVQGGLIVHAVAINSAPMFDLLLRHGATVSVRSPYARTTDTKGLMGLAFSVRSKLTNSLRFSPGKRDAELKENLHIIRGLLQRGIELPDENAMEYGHPKLSAVHKTFADDAELQKLRAEYLQARSK